MLILILIDVQCSQKVVFSFEKSSFLPPPPPFPSLTTIWKTLLFPSAFSSQGPLLGEEAF